jgi:hypothetical protein
MPFDINQAPDGVIVSGSGAAANAVPIGPYDTSKFLNCVVQIVGTFVGTVVFEGSNDETNPTNWFPMLSSNVSNGNLATSSTSTGIWYVPGVTKWFRTRISAYTSGTVVNNCLFTIDQLPSIQNSNQALTPTANSGSLFAKIASTASTNATLVKASQGTVLTISLTNTAASARYVKFHNVNTTPTAGSTAVAFTVGIPANNTITVSNDVGILFSTGIGYSITTGVIETDATATAANDVVGFITYA